MPSKNNDLYRTNTKKKRRKQKVTSPRFLRLFWQSAVKFFLTGKS
jgi:hypothetical protein